jgi:hypothetical protein
MKAIAITDSAAKQTSTQSSPIPDSQVGNTSISAKLATQSELAPIEAACPRTSVGNVSPWIVQPMPPTPTANEEMKPPSPTVVSTVFGVPLRSPSPAAAISANTIIPL